MCEVRVARLNEPKEATDFLALFTEYTRSLETPGGTEDEMIPPNLVEEIKKRPDVAVFLAYRKGHPVGFAVTVEGFSTFRALPVLNIHDIGVARNFREQGVGKTLLSAIRTEAKKRGCCKLSLEVNEHNASARHLYQAMGYSTLTGNDASERTLFMVKPL